MANVTWLIVLLCYGCFNIYFLNAAYYDDENTLRTAVLNGYQYKIRPDSTVTVGIRLSLLNINVLDVPTQRLSVSGWLVITWSDPRLTWTPATYSNIEDIFDTELVLWRPEIIVDNSVSNLGILESDKLLIRALFNGSMKWEPPGIFETHCDVDVTYYPFDTQVCMVEVTSWAYTQTEVDLVPESDGIDLVDFQKSGEWDVLSTWTERKLLVDGADTHAEVVFLIKLRRKPAYYVTTVLIPVIVTSILCIFVFLLPADSGEKVGYSLTILLTYTVMLTLVASYMPPTSKHTSVLSVYLTIILFVGVFSTLLTVIVLKLHHRPEEFEVPKWLQSMTRGCLAPIARKRTSKAQNDTKPGGNGHSINKVHPMSTPTIAMAYNNNYSHTRGGTTFVGVRGERRAVGDTRGHSASGGDRERARRQTSPREEASEDSEPNCEYTWQEIAVILDSACLRIMGVFVFTLTLVVLLTMLIGGYTET